MNQLDTPLDEKNIDFDLNRFLGEWSFVRAVNNGTTMVGLASLEHDRLGTAYSEKGTAYLPDGATVQFTKNYFFQACGIKLDVFFDEERSQNFHRLRMQVEGDKFVGRGLHLCRADEYRSEYGFQIGGFFSVIHSVRGPKKNCVIETNYRRLEIAPEQCRANAAPTTECVG